MDENDVGSLKTMKTLYLCTLDLLQLQWMDVFVSSCHGRDNACELVTSHCTSFAPLFSLVVNVNHGKLN